MELGTWLEPFIADKYAEKTGRTLTPCGLKRHPEHAELIVHVDREINDPERAGPGALEIKALGRATFFKAKREGMASDYMLQLSHAILVGGYNWGSFAVMNRETAELLWWDEERDETLCAQIHDEALKFWALVENGPAPERFPPDDQRCHRCPYSYQCQGEAMEALVRAQGEGTEQDVTLTPLVQEFLETRDLRDQAKDIHDGVVEHLKTAMGDRILVQVPGAGKVQYKPNLEWDTNLLEIDRPDIARAFRTKWDLTALSKAHPELEKNYKRVGTTRPLRVFALR